MAGEVCNFWLCVGFRKLFLLDCNGVVNFYFYFFYFFYFF